MTKIPCDICGKKFNTLICYSDEVNPATGTRWWICLRCFARADDHAEAYDRWPDARDFIAIINQPPR